MEELAINQVTEKPVSVSQITSSLPVKTAPVLEDEIGDPVYLAKARILNGTYRRLILIYIYLYYCVLLCACGVVLDISSTKPHYQGMLMLTEQRCNAGNWFPDKE